jgi:DNA/RNA endonuclease G (NUC1)
MHSLKLFKRTLCLFAVAMLASGVEATINQALQMQLGNPSGAVTDPNNRNNFLIQRTVLASGYSDILGEPTWSSWNLTSPDIGSAPRSSSFYTDTNLPPTFYRVKTGDYTYSGFDRGHMVPSEDRTDTTSNNRLVFRMSNIIPQRPDNNQGPWASLETFSRNLALAGNEMLISCGPSVFNGAYIPSGVAAIPGFTWKIIIPVPAGSGTAVSRINASTRVIAVKVPNVAGIRSTSWTNYRTSISSIEADTGFRFLTALAPSVAEVLRARIDGRPAAVISSFAPTSAVAGASVTIRGSNFAGASAVKFNGVNAAFVFNTDGSLTATVPTNATSGAISIITPGGLATSAGRFTFLAGTVTPAITRIVISQVYGGGGNTGATYKNDFIELYNAGNTTVNLSAYSVQYAPATSATWSQTLLSGSLAPGKYYLVRQAGGTSGTLALPTAQATGSINLAVTGGKVALTKTTTRLAVSNPLSNADVVDFVGYGTANAFEGTAAAVAHSATTSLRRAGNGATDTNNNRSDFSAGTVLPRNN